TNNQLKNWNGQAYIYDLNGNLSNDGQNTYTWNSRNQLTGLTGAHTSTYQYDAFGRRTSRTVDGSAKSIMFDGGNTVQETAGGVTSQILAGPGLDEWYAQLLPGSTLTLLTDALGSTL